MKRPSRSVTLATAGMLMAASLLAVPGAGLTDESSSRPSASSTGASTAPSGSSLDPHRFDRVKSLLRMGAYAQALAALEPLLEASPEDPMAQLYRRLCEQRMQTVRPFAQLSAEQWQALQGQLGAEEHRQRRSAAMQKAVSRQIEREQARWDRELDTAHRRTEREAARTQRQQQAQAAADAQVAREQALALEQQQAVSRLQQEAAVPQPPAGAAEEPARTQEPSRVEVLAPPPPAVSKGAVELAPVTVPTAPETPVSPSLVGKTLPLKGVVQIHARQMSVSPDQRVAVADGDVEVVFENALLICDHLTLFTDTKDVYAEGHVRVEEGTQVFRGEIAHYNFETKKGRFLQGTVSSPPWHEHGRAVEHLAEGVYEVTPGYLTTCELEPPHFRLAGRRAIVFSGDRLARISNVALFVEQLPFLYLPYAAFADRQSPFFIIPGKKKPWGSFALMGYRYALPGPGDQKGTLRMDWRTNFGWGEGLDHQFDSPLMGKGLFKVYYNQDADRNKLEDELPKGADKKRYRVLWRHRWNPLPDTTVVTDIQKFSDADFRKDFLFREEFISDDVPESYVSLVTNDPNYTLTGLIRKRINRFQTLDTSNPNALPQLTLDVRPQQIGDSWLFSESALDVGAFGTKTANSDADEDVVRLDWFQQLKYALNWFRPLEVTPKAGIRQTYYSKDRQGSDREGDRHILSGQWNTGVETSLKLFRVFPVVSNVLGLNVNMLRHVLTPTVSYDFIHRPTVHNDLLTFPAAGAATNRVTFGIENKLQTKRPDGSGKLRGVDLGRLLVSVPYDFRGPGNKRGGRLGDWFTDLEAYPTPWLRLETDWTYQSVKQPADAVAHSSLYNLDLTIVGGREHAQAKDAPQIQAPQYRAFEAGTTQALSTLMPRGQWSLGLGHRYSRNDKTEDVIQYDWQVSKKWQIGAYQRFTWKEVAGGRKRFNNLREYQYRLRRDLHDWIGELIYHVDREFGEELYFTLTLKAYPELPIGLQESYHEPKIGSQSSPFSPIRTKSTP